MPDAPAKEKGLMLRLPESMLDACRKRATAQRRSLNAQLLCVIEAWLQTEDRQEGARYVYQPGQSREGDR